MSALATFRAYLDAHIGTVHHDVLLRLAQSIADSSAEEEPMPQEVVFNEIMDQRESEFYKAWWEKMRDAEKQEYDDELGQADKDKYRICATSSESDAALTSPDPLPPSSALRERKGKRERAREGQEKRKARARRSAPTRQGCSRSAHAKRVKRVSVEDRTERRSLFCPARAW